MTQCKSGNTAHPISALLANHGLYLRATDARLDAKHQSNFFDLCFDWFKTSSIVMSIRLCSLIRLSIVVVLLEVTYGFSLQVPPLSILTFASPFLMPCPCNVSR